MTPIFKNPGRGRPKSEVEKVLAGYKIQSTITRNQKVIEQELHRKDRFIIATNNLDKQTNWENLLKIRQCAGFFN